MGKSNPKLLSDLFWWVSDTEQVLKKVKSIDTGEGTRALAVAVGSLFGSEAIHEMNIEWPAMRFYTDDETSEENGMVTILLSMARALICLDAFWSWERSEERVFVLHLFSAFIWATTNYLVSDSQFHPATVKDTYELYD